MIGRSRKKTHEKRLIRQDSYDKTLKEKLQISEYLIRRSLISRSLISRSLIGRPGRA